MSGRGASTWPAPFWLGPACGAAGAGVAGDVETAAAAVAAVYCGARVAMGTGRDLRHAVQRRVARFSGREMDRFGTPSLITRGTNDVQQIQMLTMIEKTPFFRTVRDHTIMGMFAAPQHGGNFKKTGWTQIGYDDSLNFRAPFGAYDKA